MQTVAAQQKVPSSRESEVELLFQHPEVQDSIVTVTDALISAKRGHGGRKIYALKMQESNFLRDT